METNQTQRVGRRHPNLAGLFALAALCFPLFTAHAGYYENEITELAFLPSATLTSTNWSASSGVTTSNGTNYLNVPSPTGKMFFKLTHP